MSGKIFLVVAMTMLAGCVTYAKQVDLDTVVQAHNNLAAAFEKAMSTPTATPGIKK